MNLLDRVIGYLSPSAGLKRTQARAAMGLVRKYEAASTGRRTDGWNASRGTSANAEIQNALHILRDRHRDLVRNNPWAARAVDVIDVETVGYGITAEIKGPKKLQELWESWAESTACDADGVHDIYGLQGLAMHTVPESGEILLRRRWRRASDGYPVPLQIQALEPDYLDHTKTMLLPGGGRIIQGVEFDAIGKRVAYWLYREHPGDVLSYKGESVRVPASEIAHVFFQKRAGQVRGVPWGAPVILTLRDLDEYEDAYLLRNKLANCFMGVLEDSATSLDGNSAAKNLPLPEQMEPGAFATVPAGKKIVFNDPPKTDGYGNYPKNVLLRIAAGYGITYQSLTGDLASVNFSSGRMGWIHMQRNIEAWRWRMLIPQGLEVIGQWFLEAAQMIGAPTEGASFVWTPPRREMLDPTKEVPATIKAVRGGLKSLPEAHRELGYNSKNVLAEIAESNKQIDDLGLVLDCDPRKVSTAGLTQARPDGTKIPSTEIAEETEETDDEETEETDDEETEG